MKDPITLFYIQQVFSYCGLFKSYQAKQTIAFKKKVDNHVSLAFTINQSQNVRLHY